MNMKGFIFVRKTDDSRRFWFSVSSKNADGDYVSANISARLSTKAREALKGKWVATKNDEIRKCSIEITDCWLSAVEGKEDPFVILFINDAKVAEKKQSKITDEDF